MLLDNGAWQQRTFIQITQVTDSNELVQVTQTNLILRQNNNMVTADFAFALSRSIRIFRINGIVLRLAVADKITLHAENQLQVTALRRIKAERKGLHYTMVGNRQSLVAPTDSLLYKALHRRQAIKLTHLRMAMQLNPLGLSIIHALLLGIELHNAARHHAHLVKGKAVWCNITLQTQAHTWLQQIFKLIAFLARVAAVALVKAQLNENTAGIIAHIKGQDNGADARFLINKGLQRTILIQTFNKGAFDNNVALFLSHGIQLTRCALDFLAPQLAVSLLFSV